MPSLVRLPLHGGVTCISRCCVCPPFLRALFFSRSKLRAFWSIDRSVSCTYTIQSITYSVCLAAMPNDFDLYHWLCTDQRKAKNNCNRESPKETALCGLQNSSVQLQTSIAGILLLLFLHSSPDPGVRLDVH